MNRLPGFITRNFRLKVGCALLAVITWTGVVYAGNPPQIRQKSVPVPQQASSIPPAFKLISKIPDLQLRLGGTRDSLNNFDLSSLEIRVNWKSVKRGGLQSIPITVNNSDPNVELLDAPTAVQANIDTITSVTVPITIVPSNPPAGILLGAQSASPSAVTVVGPLHELSGIIARVNVDLSSSRANYQAVLSVYPSSAGGSRLNDVEVTPASVTVSIALSSSITSRVVAVKPTIVGRVSSGFVLAGVAYSPQTVTISGPQDLLNTIDSVSTATISINGLTGNVVLTEPLQLPDGVSASSASVSVTLQVNAVAPATPPPPSPSPT